MERLRWSTLDPLIVAPSPRVVSLESIGPLNQSSWVSGGRRGGSVPVGAAPEHGEAPRDLPVAKEVEQRGFLERFVTQRTVHRIAGEFSLSAGSFSQNHQSAHAGCPRGPPCAPRAVARGLGRAVKLSFPFFLSESSSLLFHVND
jgi:hypothetical protein